MTEQIIRHDSIDPDTGKPMYLICDRCNFDHHECPWCGENLTHSEHDSDGNLHNTAFCRPDLVAHEPGPLCTWPDTPELNKYREPGCYWDHEKGKMK